MYLCVCVWGEYLFFVYMPPRVCECVCLTSPPSTGCEDPALPCFSVNLIPSVTQGFQAPALSLGTSGWSLPVGQLPAQEGEVSCRKAHGVKSCDGPGSVHFSAPAFRPTEQLPKPRGAEYEHSSSYGPITPTGSRRPACVNRLLGPAQHTRTSCCEITALFSQPY